MQDLPIPSLKVVTVTHGFLRDSVTGITQYEAGNREWIFLEVDATTL